MNVAIVLQICRRSRRIERLRRSSLEKKHITQPKRKLLLFKDQPRISCGRYDSAPVRISPEDRRLDKGAVRHGLGHPLRLGIVAAAFHLNRDEMRRSFGIGRDGTGQVGANSDGGVLEASQALTLETRFPATRFLRTVGQEQQRIVGAGMPLDTDTVERLRRGSACQRGQVCRGNGSIGQDERQHRRHVRPDHGRALGKTGEADFHTVNRHGLRRHLDMCVGG